MSNYRDHVPGAFTDDYDWWDDWGIDDEAEVSVYIHRDAARAWQALRDWLDKPTWQPIETAPTVEDTPVLVLDFFGDCEVAYWDAGFRKFQDAEGNQLWAVHWMPLPQPPIKVTP